MSKFKIGDRVKVVLVGPFWGREGTVTDVHPSSISVKHIDGTRIAWSYESSLELLPTPGCQPTNAAPAQEELTHAERKQRPVLTGLLDYFPDACREVAHCSHVCNEQHNPGEPMHWAKDKSIGRGDEIVRHLMDRSKVFDTDGVRVLAKAAWRALELLQRQIEAERANQAIEEAVRKHWA